MREFKIEAPGLRVEFEFDCADHDLFPELVKLLAETREKAMAIARRAGPPEIKTRDGRPCGCSGS